MVMSATPSSSRSSVFTTSVNGDSRPGSCVKGMSKYGTSDPGSDTSCSRQPMGASGGGSNKGDRGGTEIRMRESEGAAWEEGAIHECEGEDCLCLCVLDPGLCFCVKERSLTAVGETLRHVPE